MKCSLAPACAAALFAALAAAPALAAPRSTSLHLTRLPGAEGCHDPEALAAAVERRLGRPVFVPPARAELLIEGRIEPAPSPPSGPVRIRAHLVLTDAQGAPLGVRDLEAPSCAVVDQQLELVIALIIDPDAALAPEPSPPPTVQPPPPPPPPVQRDAPPAGRLVGAVAAGVAVGAGLLPGASVGLALRGEITPRSLFPLEVGVDVFHDAGVVVPGQATAGATIFAAYGLVGLCPLTWARGGTRLSGCAELQVGAIRSQGYGFTIPGAASQSQPLVQTALAGRMSRRLVGPLTLGTGIGLAALLDRPRFYYTTAEGAQRDLFRPAPVAGVVDVSLGLTFP